MAGARRSASARRRRQPAKPHRIDVHHHIVPPAQRKMNIERIGGKGGPAWSVQMSLDDMDKGGVAYSITSILNPGPWYGKIEEASRELARECNDYAAKLRSDHPEPLRHLRGDRAGRRRGQPEGDRIRLRHPQGRGHRAVDQLRRQVSRQRDLRAGAGGAQPPQGRGLCPPDAGRMLREGRSARCRRAPSNTRPTPPAPSPA